MAAVFLQNARQVLDIGAGKMSLRKYLPTGCAYSPADLSPLEPDAINIDLNTQPVPTGPWDTVVMLGVLEYVYSPKSVLKSAQNAVNHCVLSYTCATTNSQQMVQKRRDVGWTTDFNEEELRAVTNEAGFDISNSKIFTEFYGVKVVILDLKSAA